MEWGGVWSQIWGTMQTADCLGELATSMSSQVLGDTGLRSWKGLPPPSSRGTGPTALAAATKFPNCGPLKLPCVPAWRGASVARRGKKSLSDHPAGKAKKGSG